MVGPVAAVEGMALQKAMAVAVVVEEVAAAAVVVMEVGKDMAMEMVMAQAAGSIPIENERLCVLKF